MGNHPRLHRATVHARALARCKGGQPHGSPFPRSRTRLAATSWRKTAIAIKRTRPPRLLGVPARHSSSNAAQAPLKRAPALGPPASPTFYLVQYGAARTPHGPCPPPEQGRDTFACRGWNGKLSRLSESRDAHEGGAGRRRNTFPLRRPRDTGRKGKKKKEKSKTRGAHATESRGICSRHEHHVFQPRPFAFRLSGLGGVRDSLRLRGACCSSSAGICDA